MCVLCRTCAESSNIRPCDHDVTARVLTSVWTIQELAYAETLGYRVIAWHELMAYYQADTIFKRFLQLMGSYKVRYSGFPDDVKSDEERRAYCEEVNETMGLQHRDAELSLTPECVSNNRQLRDAFKLGSNRLVGSNCPPPPTVPSHSTTNQSSINHH